MRFVVAIWRALNNMLIVCSSHVDDVLWSHGYSIRKRKSQEFVAWNNDRSSEFWMSARSQLGNRKGESRRQGWNGELQQSTFGVSDVNLKSSSDTFPIFIIFGIVQGSQKES